MLTTEMEVKIGQLGSVSRRQNGLFLEPFSEQNKTHIEIDNLSIYLESVRHFPRLTHDQEISLAKSIEEGKIASVTLSEFEKSWSILDNTDKGQLETAVTKGKFAWTRFVVCNQLLVVHFAKQAKTYSNTSLDDLIQAGQFGLLQAVDNFDWRYDYHFSTYASYWIKKSIDKYHIDNLFDIKLSYRNARRALYVSTLIAGSTDPTISDLAIQTGLSDKQLIGIVDYLSTCTKLTRLDKRVGKNKDIDYLEVNQITHESSVEEIATKNLMRDAFKESMEKALTDREKLVIEHRFGMNGATPKTLEEVGEMFNLTRQRVKQIQDLAFAKLRQIENVQRWQLTAIGASLFYSLWHLI